MGSTGAFAATGVLVCGSAVSTAQLVGSADVIVTAAHPFYRDASCRVGDLRSCYFSLRTEASARRYRLLPRTLRTGSECSFSDPSQDWATVRLSRKVEGANPYPVPARDVRLTRGTQIVQVSAADRNLSVAGRHPRSIQTCTIREVNEGAPIPLKTDCDTGTGSSGAAQFVTRGDPGNAELQPAAINVGEAATARDGAPYDATMQFNVSVPLSGDFLRSVHRSLGL